MKTKLAEQAEAASEKYRPDLQVDLPIGEDLRALGGSAQVLERFDRLVHSVTSTGKRVHVDPAKAPKDLQALYQDLGAATFAVVEACEGVQLQVGTIDEQLLPLQLALKAFSTSARCRPIGLSTSLRVERPRPGTSRPPINGCAVRTERAGVPERGRQAPRLAGLVGRSSLPEASVLPLRTGGALGRRTCCSMRSRRRSTTAGQQSSWRARARPQRSLVEHL